MTYREILRLPMRHLRQYRMVFSLGLCLILIVGMYPSDIQGYRATPYGGYDMPAVVLVEDKLRHLNTIAAFAVPLVLRDWVGLKQLSVVVLAGTAATHIPKHVLDRVTIGGTRLGERPNRPTSRHNMPSGHSSLASAVIWFLGRRYGWGWLALTVPITLATMGTRVLLNAHTISAVLVGALVGLLVTALFVTRREKPSDQGVTAPVIRTTGSAK